MYACTIHGGVDCVLLVVRSPSPSKTRKIRYANNGARSHVYAVRDRAIICTEFVCRRSARCEAYNFSNFFFFEPYPLTVQTDRSGQKSTVW